MVVLIALIFGLTVIEFLILWLGCYFDLPDYTNWGEDVIWITKNRELNWFFTYFLPPHAIMYEKLCEHINGEGLAILLVLLSLITLPVTLLMSLIGMTILSIRLSWQYFCRVFARKE